MAGLNANVTLGSGVVPIPGQVSLPPGPDELTFGDAFAEAQAARPEDVDARAAARNVAPSPRSNRIAPDLAIRAADSRHDATSRPAMPPIRGSAAGASSGRSLRRGRSAGGAARTPDAADKTAAPPAAGLPSAPTQIESEPATAGSATSSGAAAAGVSGVGAVGSVDSSAAASIAGTVESSAAADTGAAAVPSAESPADATAQAAPSAAAAATTAAGPAQAAATAGPAVTAGATPSTSSDVETTLPKTAPTSTPTHATPDDSGLAAAALRTRGTAGAPARGWAGSTASGAASSGGQSGVAQAVSNAPAAGAMVSGPSSQATPAAPAGPSATIVGAAATPQAPAVSVSGSTPAAAPGPLPSSDNIGVPQVQSGESGADSVQQETAPASVAEAIGQGSDAAAAAASSLESLRYARPVAPSLLPFSDADSVPTVTSLPTTSGSRSGAASPGAGASTVSGLTDRTQPPGSWASPDVPVIVKGSTSGSHTPYASISGRAVVQGATAPTFAVQYAGSPASPAGQTAPGATGPAVAATPATTPTPATAITAEASSWGAAQEPATAPSTPAAQTAGPASTLAGDIARASSADQGTAAVGTPAANAPAASATPATPATAPSSSTTSPGAPAAMLPQATAVFADGAHLVPRVIRHGGPSFSAFASESASPVGGPRGSTVVAQVGSAASTGTASGGSDGASSSGSDPSTASLGNAPVAPGGTGNTSFSAAASVVAGAATVANPATGIAQANGILGAASPVDLVDAAEKLMNQAVQTIHSYQTAAGPSVEARINDPNFGDVRVIVTGRAGEIVQAQLIVRDRVSADAITAAAARMHATGDALAGVSLSVRSEAGGSSTNGRAGSNAFESAGWAAGGGYGAGSGSGSNGGHGPGLGNQNAAASGNGTGSESRGGGASHEPPKPAPGAVPATAAPHSPIARAPRQGGSSLDVRA
jgi:trimeric autotransporter adhesin